MTFRLPLSRLALLLAAIAACALSIAPRADAAGPARRGVQLVGIRAGMDPHVIDIQLDLAKRLGATMVRTEVLWGSVEPDAAGTTDGAYLALVDRFINGAASRKLKVLLTVDSTPCWASSAPAAVKGDCSTAGQRDGANSYPPNDPAEFGRIAGFLAGRYATKLAGFGVWNEPDQANREYFNGPANEIIPRYVAMLRAAYPAIKAAAPKVTVVGGSFVGGNGAFLQQLYNAGIKGYYDVLGVHFYDLVLQSLKQTRQTQLKNGDAKPLWLVEYGWTSCYPAQQKQGQHACVSRKTQGTNLSDIIRALRKASYVKAAIAYNIQDDAQYNFGLIDRNGRLKPAYSALRHVLKAKKALPRKIKVRLSAGAAGVVASGSGPAGDNYQMDVSQNGKLRYRVAFRLDRSNHFRLVIPAQLGRHGLSARVFQYWLGGRGARARLR